MATVDGWLETFLHGPPAFWVVLLISLALGLRHASDPDHLAAVTTLIASEKEGRGTRKAGSMGLSWGWGTARPWFSSAFRSCCWDVTCLGLCSRLRRR